jgi:pimeloyl-ACP methyl ester carboxylesterase
LDGEIRKVDVPVFFFLGQHDSNTPSPLAVQYLQRLDAPRKRLVWFDQSAHFPFFEEPALFRREMIRAAWGAAQFWEEHGNGIPVPTAAAGC